MFVQPGASPCTSVLRVDFIWYPPQWFWCSSGATITRTGSLFRESKNAVTAPLHLHQNHCNGYQMNLFVIRRCKDYTGGHPLSVYMFKVNPYFRNNVLIPTSPCTYASIVGFDWYSYQCFRCRCGGARTGFIANLGCSDYAESVHTYPNRSIYIIYQY